jgi:nitrite reductase/ring-hydroxylating ferredoxin subunit
MTPLCHCNEITTGHPVIVRLSPTASIILLRIEDGLVAYRNVCPHMGIELDWEAGRLLTRGGRYIQCSGHGARFDPASGHCLRGPCAGESLTSLPVRIVAGMVMLDEQAAKVGEPSGSPRT